MINKVRIADLIRNKNGQLVLNPNANDKKTKGKWTEEEVKRLKKCKGKYLVPTIHKRFFYYRTFNSVKNKYYRI